MELKNQNLTQQKIILTDEKVNILGPYLEMNRCQIMSDCKAKALLIIGFKMKGGVFEQSRTLSNFHFENAHFDNVLFKGDYAGCDFGDWDLEERSSIMNCDFSLALLDGCRFLRCDPESIQFPKWPCFTIINPSAVRQYVLSQRWPDGVGRLLDIYTDVDPE